MIDTAQLAAKLNAHADFAASSKHFDGAIQLDLGEERVWIKVFMGRAIHVTLEPPPFGYTFAIKGTYENWRFALEGPKNRFREAVFTQKLFLEGNVLEFSRIGKAVHGMTEVLREMVKDGTIRLEGKT